MGGEGGGGEGEREREREREDTNMRREVGRDKAWLTQIPNYIHTKPLKGYHALSDPG